MWAFRLALAVLATDAATFDDTGFQETINLLQTRAQLVQGSSTAFSQLALSGSGGEKSCHASGDVHLRGQYSWDVQMPGLWNAMINKDGSEVVQVWQCWGSVFTVNAVGNMRGLAIKLGDFYMAVLPTSFEEARDSNFMWTSMGRVFGCVIGIGGERKLTDDCAGTYGAVTVSLEHHGTSGIGHPSCGTCMRIRKANSGFDLLTCPECGEGSLTMEIHMRDVDEFTPCDLSKGLPLCSGCGQYWGQRAVPGGGRPWEAQDSRICGAPVKFSDDPATNCYEASLFELMLPGINDEYCTHCAWTPNDLSNPPGACALVTPEPPLRTIPQKCEDSGCDIADAQANCAPLENMADVFEECVFDQCSIGCQADIVSSYMEEENEEHPTPVCGDGECNVLPTEMCKTAVKGEIDTVKEDTLDDGSGKVVFGAVASVNGRDIDLEVQANAAFQVATTGGPRVNNGFGVLNVLCGIAGAELTFTAKYTDTGETATMPQWAVSFYDLDEGKKGRGRTTLEVCGTSELVLTSNTELDNSFHAPCAKLVSTTKGSSKDNPTNPLDLTSQQRARTATMYFRDSSSFTVKLDMAKCSKGKGRNVLFSLKPILACPAGVDLVAMGVRPSPDGEEPSGGFCAVNGCSSRKGCCMTQAGGVLGAWSKPSSKLRDTCLKKGFRWCTTSNNEILAKERSLAEAAVDVDAYLSTNGVRHPTIPV